MTITDYLLITLLVFTLLYFPLIKKAISLLEIFVQRYVQSTVEKKNEPVIKEDSSTIKTVLNLKLLAYERIVLFIERMKPDSLVPRTLSASLTNREYQTLLINEARKEFEYNLSQQLYLSEKAWMTVVNFKDSVITLINSAAAECKPEAPAGILAKRFLELYITSDLKVDRILKVIKSDIQ